MATVEHLFTPQDITRNDEVQPNTLYYDRRGRLTYAVTQTIWVVLDGSRPKAVCGGNVNFPLRKAPPGTAFLITQD